MFAPKSESQISQSWNKTTVYLGWDRYSAMADYCTAQHGLEVPMGFVAPDAVATGPNWGAPARVIVRAAREESI